jgi:SAM-dependent methyltransferase
MTPTLFDAAALSMRAARAARLWPRGDFLHRRAAEAIAERAQDTPRDLARLAIVGAGGGLYAQALRGVAGAARTVQLDLAPMAAVAAATAPWAETIPLDGALEGAWEAALEPGAFDLVVSGLALHRENDPVGALIRMRRALRPDGLFLGCLLAGRSCHELRAALAEAEAAEEGGLSPRVSPMADIRDLGGLLQRAQFAMPVADMDRVRVDYADPLALMRDLRAMGEANALAERRRTPLRRATLARACAVYVEHFSTPQGRVAATFELAHLSGWSPGPDQPTPKRPGSAGARLADALGVPERPAGEKAGR